MRTLLLFLTLILLCTCTNSPIEKRPGICLSFDDRSIDAWFQMRSLFNKNNVKVTFFVTQPDSLSARDVQQLKILHQDGHEIGFHGNLHVVSENYIQENSYSAYLHDEIESGLLKMDSLGFSCKSFAYPYGATYWFTDYLLLKKFQHIRTVSTVSKIENITTLHEIYYSFDNVQKHTALGLDYRTGITTEMIDQALARSLKNKEVLMLYAHAPAIHDQQSSYGFSLDLLAYLIEKVNTNNMQYFRFQDL